jgi:4-amino-4-deoxy-L-arabinose transferase-like glycosyltransferase
VLTTPAIRARRLIELPSFTTVCFVAYMALRTGVLFVRPLEQSSDFQWYYGRAMEIASGAGYAQNGVLTAFWPVGWPGFLAVLFTVTGPFVLAGQVANLILSALVFALTLSLGAALFRNPLVGRAAVLILTVYPNQIGYVPLLSTEIFYEFLLLLSISLLMRERLLPALAAGVGFGVATLTKTQSLLLPVFVLAGVWVAAPSRQALGRLASLICAVYVALFVVVAPWTYRNYLVFNAFIPVSTNGGWTLLSGNNPEANGDYTPDTVLALGLGQDPTRQVQVDRLARERAIGWIRENPLDFLALAPKKMLRLWAPDGEAEWFYQRGFAGYDNHWWLFRAVRGLNQVYYFVILLMALPTIWRLYATRAGTSSWATVGIVLCVYYSLISLIFSGQSRFHFSLMPFIAIYAAATLVRGASEPQAASASTTFA